MRRWIVFGLVLFGSASSVCSRVYSQSVAPSLSARAAGRGGANLAFDDNGNTLLDNPAGLIGVTSLKDGKRIDFFEGNLGASVLDSRYSDPQNANVSADTELYILPSFTIGHRYNQDLAIGLGVYSPVVYGSQWNLEGPPGLLAGPQSYQSFGTLWRILPGMSYQMTQRLRLGATLGLAASEFNMSGPYFANSSPITGLPTLIDIDSSGLALSWSGGIQYALSERITLAGRYQSQNRFQNEGTATVSVPGVGSATFDADVGMTWPSSIGVGMQYKLSRQRRLGFDVDWQKWSSAFSSADITLSNPSDPTLAALMGTNFTEVFPMQWNDAILVRSGIEQDFGKNQTFRCGYSFNSDPTVGATANNYLSSILAHHFSLGYGWRSNGWSYDAAYQYAFRPTQHVGTSDLPGGDFSNSSISNSAHLFFAGATKRF